jgi:hypothetical protein
MIASNLAEHHQKFGFTIKLTNLNAFLTGHRFCTSSGTVSFEVATSKMDYNAFINGTKPTTKDGCDKTKTKEEETVADSVAIGDWRYTQQSNRSQGGGVVDGDNYDDNDDGQQRR